MLVLLFLIAAAEYSLWCQTNDGLRIAVIARQPDVLPMADLITAALSKEEGLRMLERSEMERIVGEQALTQNNLIKSIATGRLLGADGLLLCESIELEGKPKIVARFVAVKAGAVLTSFAGPFPLAAPAEWTELLRKHLRPSIPKLRSVTANAVPVSFLNLRSSSSSAEAVELEQTLNTLFINRLEHASQVVLLERQRLEALAWEKELMGLGELPFWNGAYLLEGAIDPDGFVPGKVVVQCRLQPPDAREAIVFKVSGSRTRLQEMVEQLTAKVRDSLRMQPEQALWNPAGEAQRYFEEAQWAKKWGLLPQAQMAAESSWGMGNRSPALEELRIRAYAESAQTDIGSWTLVGDRKIGGTALKPGPRSIMPAIRALELFGDSVVRQRAEGHEPTLEWYSLGVDAMELGAKLLQHYWFQEYAFRRVHETELAQLRRRLRECVVLLEEDSKVRAGNWERRSIVAPGNWNSHWLKMQYGSFWQETPEEGVELLKSILVGPQRQILHAALLGKEEMTPYLVDWRAPSSDGLSNAWSKCIRELSGSTNLALQVDAIVLQARGYRAPWKVPVQEFLSAGQRIVKISQEYPGSLVSEEGDALFEASRFVLNQIDQTESKPELDALRREIVPIIQKVGQARQEVRVREREKADAEAALAREREKAAKLQALMDQATEFKKVFELAQKPDDKQAERVRWIFWSTEAAETLLSAVTNYNQRVGLTAAGKSMERHLLSMAHRPVPPSDTKVATNVTASVNPTRPRPLERTTPTPVTLAVSKFFTPSPLGPKALEMKDISVVDARYREGRLWAEVFIVAYLPPGAPEVDHSPIWKQFVGVDLKTFQAVLLNDRTDKPETDSRWRWVDQERSFEVVNGRLYTSQNGELEAITTSSGKSIIQSVPIKNTARISAVAGKLFLSTQESVLVVDPDTAVTRVLASTRRRPAASPLDMLDALGSPHIVQAEPGRIRTAAGGKVYEYDLGATTWREMSRAGYSGNVGIWCNPSNDSLLFGFDGKRWEALFGERENRELMLAADAAFNRGVEHPHWRTRADCYGGTAVFDGGDLWMVLRAERNKPETKLLHFDPRFEDPVEVSLDFQPADRWSKIYVDGRKNGYTDRRGPMLIPTPEGIVITEEDATGFWLMERGAVDEAIRRARQAELEAWGKYQRELVAKYDANGNGQLDPDEIRSMSGTRDFRERELRYKLHHWMERYDFNRDDELDAQEFNAMLGGEVSIPLEILQKWQYGSQRGLDANHNGHYDYEELADVFKFR